MRLPENPRRHEAWRHGPDLFHASCPGLEQGRLPCFEDDEAWHAWSRCQPSHGEPMLRWLKALNRGWYRGKACDLHAGSNNSATNWPLERYVACMETLVKRGYRVLWTGTAKEGAALKGA